MRKIGTLLLAIVASMSLWAQNNVIIYTADAQLNEYEGRADFGLNVDAFGVKMVTHTFKDGVGTITFDGDVTKFGWHAFAECKGLTSVTIPSSVTIIEGCAFYGCDKLSSITIPENVTGIGYAAFYGCTSLTSLTIPDKVTNIGDNAFNSVFNVIYKGSATGSPWGAKCVNGVVDGNFVYKDAKKTYLAGCHNTASGSISIPKEVDTIANSAFANCKNITSITLTDNVSSIGYGAFSNCEQLITFIVPNKVTIIQNSTFYGCKNLVSVTLHDNITEIGVYAFQNCSSLKLGSLPTKLESIGAYAFYGCENITKVNISDKVKYIGQYAFYNCYNLKTLDWNMIDCSSLNLLDEFVFVNTAITTLNIGHSSQAISYYLTYRMDSLKQINVDGANAHFTATDDVLYNYAKDSIFKYSVASSYTNYTIPATIKHIENYAFSNAKNLKYVISKATMPPTCGYSTWQNVGAIPLYVPVGCESAYNSANYWYKFSIQPLQHPNATIAYSASSKLFETTDVTQAGLHTNAFNTTINYHGWSNDSYLIYFDEDVSSIGERAFYNSAISSIMLPRSITEINANAFFDCSKLETVICLATTPPTCGTNCFSSIGSNATLYVPESSVEAYSKDTEWGKFASIKAISCIEYKASRQLTIEANGFDANIMYHSYDITTGDGYIWFDSKVTRILKNAFSSRTRSYMEEITIPGSVDSIACDVYDSENLRYISVDPANKRFCSVDGILFSSTKDAIYRYPPKKEGKDYTIPSTVKCIKESAFELSNLVTITIPEGVTCIENGAFAGSSILTTISFPESVTRVGSVAFHECRNLSQPVYNKKLFVYLPQNYIGAYTVPEGITTISQYAFYYCSRLTSVSFPASVDSIGDYTFTQSSKLNSINWPSNVRYIPAGAFHSCYSLTSITIPEGVASIKAAAFYWCTNLATCVFPQSLQEIGEKVFYGCQKLDGMTIPSTVNAIGENAFSGLRTVTYKGSATGAPWGALTINGIEEGYLFFNGDKTELITCSIGAIDVALPKGLKVIRDKAFYNCSTLVSVSLPSSLDSIGISAFEECNSLTSITIPNKVKTISKNAFYNCKKIKSVTIGNGVTNINNFAFYHCDSLTNITIPEGVTTIGNYAFNYCQSLTNITIHQGVKAIGNYAFDDCSKLRTIELPKSVTSLGTYAFRYCDSLRTIIIGSGMKSISDAFYQCKKVEKIICYAQNPPSADYWCFISMDKNIPVYVPASTIKKYGGANRWKDFKNFIALPQHKITVQTDEHLTIISGDNTLDEGCTDTLFVEAAPYYQFDCWSDGDIHNPRLVDVTCDSTFYAYSVISKKGQCGESLTWRYDSQTLYIFGEGDMYDYSIDSVPWLLLRDSITKLVVNSGVTSIGKCAFYGLDNQELKTVNLPDAILTIGDSAFANCSYLKNLTLGSELLNIGNYAFNNCTRLIYINCYATEPPALGTTPFTNYNARLSVLCSILEEYQFAMGWNFPNITCLEAQKPTDPVTQVSAQAGENDVTITWPTNTNAKTYTLDITSKGETICSLVFDQDGKLLSINFNNGEAPARFVSASVQQYATLLAGGSGMLFTVTGLNSNTNYAFSVVTKNNGGTSIESHSGTFKTTGVGPTTVLDSYVAPTTPSNKIIKDGQLYILREGKMYNAQGGEL